ncbi:alpha/beta hydrolase fold protein [Gordonia neofelifaecis NRRL B-59395]|uniref:Alpha/beta hydrolase fold protein n=1 Tax=Gordonia neofelifaecis NRRL B-59395 TaxID=644548 RepID=F1YFJ2_9ACTN|nr:alpha/beta hydrolase fold protein [Gordonia neofelifaecis NRRL B-59395]
MSEAGSLGAVTAGGAFRRRRHRKVEGRVDPHVGVDFKAIYDDDMATVTADDGVSLAVRTVTTGAPGDDGRRKWGRTATPELTVVFVHGFTLRMASWHFQRFALAERWADRHIKMVFYDQRGHGASDPASAESSTMDQLGDDLAAVIRTMAPTGPVVLVGHSMGGMSIMSLARRHSRLFSHSGRIAGVALVSTAARGITEAGLGEGLNNPIVDALRLSVRYVPRAVQAGRGITRRAVEPVLVAASFGHDFYSPSAGHAVESMIQNTSIATMVNFLHVLESHDEATALPVIAQVPTVVACGDEDRLTPLPNSLNMYGRLGRDSRMIIAEGCGHMLPMEEPDLVTDAIDDLVSRSRLALGRPVMPWRRAGG